MPTLDETINKLRGMFQRDAQNKESLRTNPSDPLALDMERLIDQHIRSELRNLLKFPPHLLMNPETLPKFHANGAYDKSVFVMTKFPKQDDESDQLYKLIQIVRRTIDTSGFVPRIASDHPWYADKLWDNVLVHLLGCERGIAIIEDKYVDELNPNVTMEWGWMRAMGKKVLYLRERTFAKERADLMGFLTELFDWDQPETTAAPAVERWLKEDK